MPPVKRRVADISRDASPSDSDADDPNNFVLHPNRRRRSESLDEDSDASVNSQIDEHTSGSHNQQKSLVKKLVRLALSTEYSRTPLRRSDISTKIFKDGSNTGASRSFRAIFDAAQTILKDTFGMQLIELPSREKTTLKDRRIAATQTKSSNPSSKSWILISILPPECKTNPVIIQPTKAPDTETEASYTALYTFIISLIYLNNGSVTEQKLARYLKRMNADTYTPLGNLDKLLQRMQREGYVEKRRDTVMGEETVEWHVGPRGKIEVGVKGVAGLVRSVYGHGAVPLDDGRGEQGDDAAGERRIKIEEEELNARLSRSLGVAFDTTQTNPSGGGRGEEEEDHGLEAGSSNRQQKAVPVRRGRRRQAQDDDDDDGDSG